MKRIVLLVTAAAVALTPLAASAGPAERVETFDYTGFSTVGAGGAGLNTSGLLPVCTVANSCWELETVKGEKTVEIEASDPTVGLQVWYDGTYADTVEMYCGTAKFTVSPKSDHVVSIRTSMGDCGGVPTEGTLTATITAAK